MEDDHATAPANGNMLQRIAHTFDVGLTNFFYRVGKNVAESPWRTMAATLLLAGALGAGMATLNVENNPERLYTPQGSEAFDDRDYVEATFGFDPRRNLAFAVARADNGPGVLTSDALLDLLDAHDALKATTATVDGRVWTRDEICYHPLGDDRCDDQSLLDLWSYNRTTIEALSNADIRAAVNGGVPLVDAIGRPMRLDDLIGGVERDVGGAVVSASALQLVFVVKNEKRPISGEEDGDPEAFAWERAATTTVYEATRGKTRVTDVEILTIATEEDEQDAAIDKDTQLLVFGYILLIIYGSLVLGRRNAVGSRSWLAYASVLAVGMAIVSGFGLCSLAGVDFSLAVAVVPFALLGLGMDDTFVIMGAHRQLSGRKDLTPVERIATALGRAGPSITLTSATDVAAFLCGTITVLPALRAFCFYAAAGMAFDFLYQVTFFVACVSLDSRREAARRPDFLCCLPARSPESVTKKACSSDEFDEGQPGAVNRLIGETLPQLTLRNGWTKAGVLLLAASLVGVAAAGLTKLETDFQIEWFTPSGSFLHDVYDVRDTYFEGSNLPYSVYTRDADYFEEQAGLQAIADAMEADRWTLDGSVRHWYVSFLPWLAANHAGDPVDSDGRPTDRALFYQRVGEFLDDDSAGGGASFKSDVLMTSDRSAITATRIPAVHASTANSGEDIDGMKAARKSAAAGGDALDGLAFAEPYVFFEGLDVIGGELVRNVIVAASAVFVVCTLLLANLQASLIVMAMIGFVDVCMLGFLYHWDLTINSVTTINAVLAVGLSVDYSAHIAHSFQVASGTRDERARKALHEIGGSVVNGATSTFLAVVVMAGAQSYVFTVFFRCFTLIIAFGLFFGIFVLPVVLSLIGPRSFADMHQGSKASVATSGAVSAAESPGGGGADGDVIATEAGKAPVALVEVRAK